MLLSGIEENASSCSLSWTQIQYSKSKLCIWRHDCSIIAVISSQRSHAPIWLGSSVGKAKALHQIAEAMASNPQKAECFLDFNSTATSAVYITVKMNLSSYLSPQFMYMVLNIFTWKCHTMYNSQLLNRLFSKAKQ